MKISVLVAAAALFLSFFAACSKDNDPVTPVQTPSQLLSSTAWETTSARNAQGASVALTDDNVKNYVGFAYFKTNTQFTMYNLDNSPKMHGDWWLSLDGKSRFIIARDANGAQIFKREVPITVLTNKEFTYRTYPDPGNTSVYIDIVHTPTTHQEPTN
ncbi:DUF4822 domain-containing protein [Niabella drilacis]|uniref:DUF4822 domain-containing protein n=1 Tax=Niabella drilacis (strain DSM 25811 / CCM 8410 / CCUG 62505 / LMG 26954 / E90) TaxID=1285928 RepID=A0A1G6IZ14_NIADE|nr:DUF4822 domain-containing protein [Niabella drilacis]SDC11719.1 protein of unknown function [Niabella drilacis]